MVEELKSETYKGFKINFEVRYENRAIVSKKLLQERVIYAKIIVPSYFDNSKYMINYEQINIINYNVIWNNKSEALYDIKKVIDKFIEINKKYIKKIK